MKALGPLARWVLTLALLAVTLYRVPIREWLPLFCDLNAAWFLLAALCMAGIVCINSLKWKLLLDVQKIHPGYARIIYHYAVGYFFNSFITGTGDVKRAADIGKEENAMAESLASVLAERWTGVLGQVGLAFATLSAALLQTPSVWPIACASALVVFFLGALYAWIENVPHKTETEGTGSWAVWVRRVRVAMSIYKGHRRVWWTCLAMSFIGPLLLVLIHIVLAKSLGISPSPWAMLVLIPTVSVFAQLPITINGFGLQDYFMVTLFEGTMLPSQALAISLVFHALRLSVGACGGLLYAIAPNFGLTRQQGNDVVVTSSVTTISNSDRNTASSM